MSLNQKPLSRTLAHIRWPDLHDGSRITRESSACGVFQAKAKMAETTSRAPVHEANPMQPTRLKGMYFLIKDRIWIDQMKTVSKHLANSLVQMPDV